MEKYPATLSIDYQGESDRIKVLFRLFLAIPILVILGLLTTSGYEGPEAAESADHLYSLGIVFLPVLLMILFRQKYPRWWFDWNLELTKFSFRVGSYFLLLRDEYPSTDSEQSVHLEIPYPDVKKDLTRWMPLVKWLLVIPHVIVIAFLMIGVAFCTFITWFIILVTGTYPKGIFEFVVGTMRWYLRVYSYAFLLTTDVYPPFSLK
ncbi:MAG: DUF4389 domain-containing protein [Acidobacteriota bacterium]